MDKSIIMCCVHQALLEQQNQRRRTWSGYVAGTEVMINRNKASVGNLKAIIQETKA
jgi:hypothetical protein